MAGGATNMRAHRPVDAAVSKYRPDLKGYVSTNAPTIEGDAINFLEKVDANFIDMDQIQTHQTVV